MMKESDFSFGAKVLAKFEPKEIDTLRPCMVHLVGKTFEFEWVGISDDDEPYPGQSRWVITRKHDEEISDECKGRWCPRQDISILRVIR